MYRMALSCRSYCLLLFSAARTPDGQARSQPHVPALILGPLSANSVCRTEGTLPLVVLDSAVCLLY